MRVLAFLLLPCVVAVLVYWWLEKDTDAPARVLVGVLSARHNRDLRDAARDTWLAELRDHPRLRHRVEVRFIVGRHGCPVPEEDREDPYSCSLMTLAEPVAGQEVEVVGVSEASLLAPAGGGAVALDLRVLQPLVITRLGAFPAAPGQQPGNITVRLFQLDQEEAVVSAQFSAASPGVQLNGVWYQEVEQFVLPKGFEGTLVWDTQDASGLTTLDASRVQLNGAGGVLKFSSVAEGILPHSRARGFPGLAGGFTFTLYDPEAVSLLLRGRAGREEARAARLREEEEALGEESRRHGDMVLLDLVDTYRSLPEKLLLFYRWSVGHATFDLLLKTDDDCYVDVEAVVRKVDHKDLRRTRLWWGNFRQSWAVERGGKWREVEYPAPAYPAFACGSGYVLSRDLVQWLADNTPHLKPYQGEDVSLGIWMAAVGPQRYQDPGWLCEQGCYVDMLSSPQHTAEELRGLWGRRRACGDPCGCPWGHAWS